jgi:hypothetical protein
MRRGEKPLESAASKRDDAQRPIESGTDAASYLAALIDRITDENRHELIDSGPPVGREFW